MDCCSGMAHTLDGESEHWFCTAVREAPFFPFEKRGQPLRAVLAFILAGSNCYFDGKRSVQRSELSSLPYFPQSVAPGIFLLLISNIGHEKSSEKISWGNRLRGCL